MLPMLLNAEPISGVGRYSYMELLNNIQYDGGLPKITRRRLLVFLVGIVALMLLTMAASVYVSHNIIMEDRTTQQRLTTDFGTTDKNWDEARNRPEAPSAFETEYLN